MTNDRVPQRMACAIGRDVEPLAHSTSRPSAPRMTMLRIPADPQLRQRVYEVIAAWSKPE